MEELVAAPADGVEVRIPAIGLGTWQLRGEQCREAVAHALSIGYRHVDTARMYGNEEAVGAGIRDSGVDRDDVLVVTKVRPGDADREGVRREVAASLGELDLGHIDLLLLHAPGPVPVEETMEAFRAEQDAGHVVHVGVSNFTAQGLERAAAEAPITCVQNEYAPGTGPGDALAWCRDHGAVFVAYSPLDVRGAVVDVLREVGARHERTWAQVALRWLLQQPSVAAIPRSRDAAHRQQNLEVLDFALSDDDLARISGAG